MKIAIYHNLQKGGALEELENIAKVLIKNENEIDLYSENNNAKIKGVRNQYIIELNKTNNIIQNIIQTLFELNTINKKFAEIINSKKYDLILIFPCILSQSPSIIRHIKSGQNLIYFFAETKREFYENVSFDYWKINKIISRILRYPIKINDILNCKKANIIITNSIYSNYLLSKIYNKKGYVVYPGIENTKHTKCIINNNRKIITVGLITKLKGYIFTLNQLKNINITLNVIGKYSLDTNVILKFANKINVNLNIYNRYNDEKKFCTLDKHRIFLSNQIKEPFGIVTSEAAEHKLVILGTNSGGTPEIIQNGVNGIIYPVNTKQAKQILIETLNKDKITIYKCTKINWDNTNNKISKIIKYN